MVRMDRLEDDRSSRRSSHCQSKDYVLRNGVGLRQSKLRPAQWGGYGVGFVGLDLGPESLNPSPRAPVYPSRRAATCAVLAARLQDSSTPLLQVTFRPRSILRSFHHMAQVQLRFRPRSILRSFHHMAQVQVRFRPRSIFRSFHHLEPNQGQRSLQSNVFQSLPRVDSTSLALEHGGLKSDLPESRRPMEADAGLAPRKAGQPQFSRETPAFGGNHQGGSGSGCGSNEGPARRAGDPQHFFIGDVADTVCKTQASAAGGSRPQQALGADKDEEGPKTPRPRTPIIKPKIIRYDCTPGNRNQASCCWDSAMHASRTLFHVCLTTPQKPRPSLVRFLEHRYRPCHRSGFRMDGLLATGSRRRCQFLQGWVPGVMEVGLVADLGFRR